MDTAFLNHGLRSPSPEVLGDRREAARHIMRALEDGPEPNRLPILREASRLWTSVFFSIFQQTSEDWFLMSGALAHPSSKEAKRTAFNLKLMADAIDRNDVEDVGCWLSALRIAHLPARLERFLACSRAKRPIAARQGGSWLYLMRSNDKWGVLNLGTIQGFIENAVQEMDDLNPDLRPYGITAAWRVFDICAAYDIAATCLQRFYIQPDFYEFDHFSEVKAMREIIYGALQKEGQIVRSPTCPSSSWPYDHRGLLQNVRESKRIVHVDSDDVDIEATAGPKPM